jgi:serine/threonine-protein kinase
VTIDPSATTSEETRALLQRRVAGFALAVGSLNAIALTGRLTAMGAWKYDLSFVPAQTSWLQAAGTACLLAIWALTRGGKPSARFVRIVETTGLLGAGACFQLLALGLTEAVIESPAVQGLARDPEHHALIVLAILAPLVGASFTLTYALVMRAAFVPTSAWYTALLTMAVGAPLAYVAYRAGQGTQALQLGALEAPALAFGGIAQWGVTVAVCTAISKVIYGLREEVREARRLGQYTLEELIGQGGMGRVYRAAHAMLRRPTAIKLLSPDSASPDALERFEREVQLTAQLTHPNTVTIYDYGRTADGVLYYAMELLDGATLEAVVEVDGPQPPARVVHILEQVAGALGEAHSIGLIHRDVKPANIVICRQGGELDVAKVVDFGLVKELDERHPATVSQEGTISGTPLYMAPEILTNSAASPRSDLYALGAVGYYLLTGEHVFGGRSVIEVLGHHLHTEPVPPSQRLGDPVPGDLEALILSCLAKDPEARPRDANELRERLEACHTRWTQRSAKTWWTVHGPALKARRKRQAVARTARTVEVDLVSRSLTDAVGKR